jgi:hypothetical protein
MLGNESIGGVTLVNRRFDPSKIYVGDDCATDKLIVSRALAVTDVFMFNDVFADSFRVNFCRAVTTASAFERMGMAGQKIRMHADARILIHSPAHYICGGIEELLAAAIEVEKLKAFVLQVLCERTKQPATTVFDWLARDTWFDAKAALACGLVDEIYTAPEVTPAPAIVGSNDAKAEPLPTEKEKAFHEWLCAWGRMPVASRERFTRELMKFATFNTDEINPDEP